MPYITVLVRLSNILEKSFNCSGTGFAIKEYE
jgi:hypothetical protein